MSAVYLDAAKAAWRKSRRAKVPSLRRTFERMMWRYLLLHAGASLEALSPPP